MKAALLTTDTTHHRAFAAAVGRHQPWHVIAVESDAIRHSFPTAHPLAALQDQYELESLAGADEAFEAEKVVHCASINDDAVQQAMRDCDVAIIFGTKKVASNLLEAVPTLNLHGGDPREYRGLDSHLWASYHRDWDGLKTSLHWAAPRLDSGALVAVRALEIPRGTQFHQLRAINTKACIDLVAAALDAHEQEATLPRGEPMDHLGRYYGAMPAVLKDLCVERFNRHFEDHDGTE